MSVRRPSRPAPFAPLTDGQLVADVYESGEMFHGPAFQCLTELRIGSTGSTAILDAGRSSVPHGQLNQGVLDAITHAVPHISPWRWAHEIPRDHIAVPHRIPTLSIFESLPVDGELRVEARFAGFDGEGVRLPVFDLQVYRDDRIVLAFRLVDLLLSIGPFARVSPRLRRAFFRDQVYVEELVLGEAEGEATVLRAETFQDIRVVQGDDRGRVRHE